ncbi:type I-E CRISPR-associated protein Cas6/Cse3/CasE [Rudanella lutea]|uniref:type I-E CRISPR-associated protein Cas6/Cse3/CasE n=1 Tax=Rudanella lutea TaxID=451374 RepID=UPI0003656F57|nr:type I-E CRISPR-associated protein Cas6/Cse3/CasE [Rudanella lutea]
MYLSKLILNPRCRDARRDVGSPYELHRTLARAFDTEPGTDYRCKHGVLFRLEPMAYAQALPTVLVQSATQPDWNELPETYLLQPAHTKPVSVSLAVGQTLAFRLVANPTKKEKREGKRQGRRVALTEYDVDEAAGMEPSDGAVGVVATPARIWLGRKGEQHGFRVLYATSDDFWLGRAASGRAAAGVKPDLTDKQRLPHYGVRFDGLLQVTDPALLAEALRQGIGPAKAFGFGLLSLAQPQ